MFSGADIEMSNKILETIPEEFKESFLFRISTLPLNDAFEWQCALEAMGIIVAYDWTPFHRDQWFFPTTTDYDDLIDYYFDMME